MFSSVPLYFRVTERASNAVASAHLLPSIVGNTTASLLTGWIIKRFVQTNVFALSSLYFTSSIVEPLFEASSTRVSIFLNLLTSSFLHRTGRYRPLVILAPCSSATCFILLYLRWTAKPLVLIESFYISLAGFSNGVSIAAVFVFLTAGTKKEDTSICSGVFYLATSVGEVTGFAVQNSILQITLGRLLPVRLFKVENKDEVCPDDANLLYISITSSFFFCILPIFYFGFFSS